VACFVDVRTAPGQDLSVQYSGVEPGMTLDQYCAGAAKLAEAAMTTLIATHG
jgi:hypothetical protein